MQQTRPLRYAPAPVDNPLKGLVPYSGEVRDRFPHSMEFNYLPLSALVVGPEQHDWTPLERLLNDVAGRGHQAIFRVFLEYPGRKNVLPTYLIEQGLKVYRYINPNTQPEPPTEVETPDYGDPRLRAALKAFIHALGERYDGDPRVAFITAGLLGTWGEWHDYPHDELFASPAVQVEVMDAYQAAFRKTPVLLRYPAGPGDDLHAPNIARPFGYHDDSFAWATLDTGKPENDWFFCALLKKAGKAAQEKWKTQPIGGEIRPEAWGRVFDRDPGDGQIQDFAECVRQTHVTWLMDTGMFREKASTERRKRAEDQVRRMGYEFHIPTVTVERQGPDRLLVRVAVINRGVAPFYQDWPLELALRTPSGSIVRTFPGHGKLTGLLPGQPPRVWEECLFLSGLRPERSTLLLRVVNPQKNGLPLRFANVEQETEFPGWLTLGTI